MIPEGNPNVALRGSDIPCWSKPAARAPGGAGASGAAARHRARKRRRGFTKTPWRSPMSMFNENCCFGNSKLRKTVFDISVCWVQAKFQFATVCASLVAQGCEEDEKECICICFRSSDLRARNKLTQGSFFEMGHLNFRRRKKHILV